MARCGRAAAVVLLALAACRPGPWEPFPVQPETTPFVRLPYVQAVGPTDAWVLWRATAAARDSFAYRPEGGSAWRTAVVERSPVPPDGGAMTAGGGPLVDRRVRLAGLAAGARIEYRVHADTFSPGVQSFRTAPPLDDVGPVRVLAFGDSGWGSESQLALARRMLGDAWDLAVHVGDIAYERGSERDFTLRHFRVYANLLASVPFFPSPGNHDLRTAGGRPYDRAFRWPGERPEVRYYTFRWGPVRFFALDSSSETAGRELRRGSGGQYDWLVAALDAASREPGVQWLVAYLHHPLHSNPSGLAGKGPDRRLRATLIPLFERYGVDLVLSGHDHHYERSRPIRNGRPADPGCGPVYVVTGGGGASLYARGIAPASTHTARIARLHHYVSLRIEPDSVVGRAIGVDGDALDEFRILPFYGAAETVRRCS